MVRFERCRAVARGARAKRLSAPVLGRDRRHDATFIAITCWWLTQDRSIPIYDAGDQLETALLYHGMLSSGNLLGPLTHTNVYPILGHMVGALAVLIGGVSVASPIVGENVVFVPLLALGCYQTGRLLFGRLAGMLAVVFVLGSPLLISMFHVFLLDAPLTALVALSVWLILASEDFGRLGVAAMAGLAVGLGLNMKAQFALFLVGLILVVLVHGGWRNWRGFAIFCAVAAVVGLPWYVIHFSQLGEMLELASSGPGTPAGNIPATFSGANYTWYFWSVLNSQLLAPLAVLAAGGMLWMLVTLVRDRGRPAARLEFFAGGFAAWVVITFPDSHHDIRYGVPLLGYLAVVATGWITRLPRPARLAAVALLVLGVTANTLGIDFGVGREVNVALAHPLPNTEANPIASSCSQPPGSWPLRRAATETSPACSKRCVVKGWPPSHGAPIRANCPTSLSRDSYRWPRSRGWPPCSLAAPNTASRRVSRRSSTNLCAHAPPRHARG